MHIPRTRPEPELRGISVVASHILCLEIQEGWIEGGIQIPYQPEAGETLEPDKRVPYLVWIVKDGERIGVKVPDPRFGDKRFPLEEVKGDPLDLTKADDAQSYKINGITPKTVWRKTKPNDYADRRDSLFGDPLVHLTDPDEYVDNHRRETCLHILYLVNETEFVPGESYTLTFPEGMLDKNNVAFRFDPRTQMSEAVHVSQVGFRPDDPAKRAYLSQWMGLGGGVSYDLTKFELIDEGGNTVFAGDITLQHDDKPGMIGGAAIGGNSAVYEMDFSEFQTPGTYRVLVPELGCSFPFTIGVEESWLRGFKASMHGLYCQRSGIETGAPYSNFSRPRCYHPEDGKKVYHSESTIFESGNGLNAYGTDNGNFGNLVRKGTDIVVENAWGGYFDACDWDRRIQHLHATLMGEELYLMFPAYFDALKLNIPESGNGIPDIINEGLYNIDFYRRLQTPEGGIRGGAEQEEHPILGQCGWQDSWKTYAYKPDFWSAYFYASAAGRAAYALRRSDVALSKVYEDSAVKAFDWAEKDYAEKLAAEGHKWHRMAHMRVKSQREMAAADIFRLTGREDCDKLYRELRSPMNYEASFIYATLPEGMGDEETREACRKSIIEAADRALKIGEETPFRLTTSDPQMTRTGPYGSFYTIPNNVQLIRAHYLTGDERYLAAAIDAAQFAAGANPSNLCYTTGMGPRCPENVLHHDSRITGQPCPDGVTVFGPCGWNWPNGEMIRMLREDNLFPGAFVWPGAESYLDVYRYPCQTEYTVQESIGPNAYQWGYLAARS
ncbi:MAG: hypothetical protein E7428_04330 [Ruminococcaceae bacterium]|nr:hypothetical protein [Oscillospiraceae bacterium]